MHFQTHQPQKLKPRKFWNLKFGLFRENLCLRKLPTIRFSHFKAVSMCSSNHPELHMQPETQSLWMHTMIKNTKVTLTLKEVIRFEMWLQSLEKAARWPGWSLVIHSSAMSPESSTKMEGKRKWKMEVNEHHLPEYKFSFAKYNSYVMQ